MGLLELRQEARERREKRARRSLGVGGGTSSLLPTTRKTPQRSPFGQGDDGGDVGIFGNFSLGGFNPLGLISEARDVAAALPALGGIVARDVAPLVGDLLTGQPHRISKRLSGESGERLGTLTGGLGKVVLGLPATALESSSNLLSPIARAVPGVDNFDLHDEIVGRIPSAVRPERFTDLARERGIAGATLQNLGALSLVAGGAGAGAGAARSVARAAASTRAGPAAARAARAATRGAEAVRPLRTPLITAASRGGRPFLRRAQAVERAQRAGRPTRRGADVEEALINAERLGAPEARAGQGQLFDPDVAPPPRGLRTGPIERFLRDQSRTPTPEITKDIIEKLPTKIVSRTARAGDRVGSWDVKRIATERRRLGEAAERAVATQLGHDPDIVNLYNTVENSPAPLAGKTAMRATINEARIRASGLGRLERAYQEAGIDPTVIDDVVSKGEPRIPAELRETPEVSAQIDRAAEAVGKAQERTARVQESLQGGRGTRQAQEGTEDTIRGAVRRFREGTEQAEATEGIIQRSIRERQREASDIDAELADVRAGGAPAADVDAVAFRKVEVENELDNLVRGLHERTIRSLAEADETRRGALASLEALADNINNQAVADMVPPEFRPLFQAIKETEDAFAATPAAREVLGEVSEALPRILEEAMAQGLNPVHIRNFTPQQVDAIIGEAFSLRQGTHGFVKRSSASPEVSRSMDAMVAAHKAAVGDLNRTAVLDALDDIGSYPVVNGEIPAGWVAWDGPDGIRPVLEGGPDELPLPGLNEVVQSPATRMVPEPVAKYLKRAIEGNKLDQVIGDMAPVKALRKITQKWRGFVLLGSARWYVNNFVGNMVLALSHGVKMQDVAQAWRQWREDNLEPSVRRATLATQGPATGLDVRPRRPGGDVSLPRAAARRGREIVQDVRRQAPQGLRAQGRALLAHVERANSTIDELFRQAVFNKTLRTTGDVERAISDSVGVLVDYNNLNDIEKAIARTVFPFYSWQKGMLKAIARVPVTSPHIIPFVTELAELNRDLQTDMFGAEFPEYYQGLIETPVGFVQTRNFNPFADASALTTSQGITSSMQPVLNAGISSLFGAEGFAFSQNIREGFFGQPVPDVSFPQGLFEIGRGLPQARLLFGSQFDPESRGLVHRDFSSLPEFAGINVSSPEEVQKIIKRTLRTRRAAQPDPEPQRPSRLLR